MCSERMRFTVLVRRGTGVPGFFNFHKKAAPVLGGPEIMWIRYGFLGAVVVVPAGLGAVVEAGFVAAAPGLAGAPDTGFSVL